MAGSKILVRVRGNWFGCVEREQLHKHDEFDRERSRLRQEVQMNVIYEVTNIRVRTAVPIRASLMVHLDIE